MASKVSANNPPKGEDVAGGEGVTMETSSPKESKKKKIRTPTFTKQQMQYLRKKLEEMKAEIVVEVEETVFNRVMHNISDGSRNELGGGVKQHLPRGLQLPSRAVDSDIDTRLPHHHHQQQIQARARPVKLDKLSIRNEENDDLQTSRTDLEMSNTETEGEGQMADKKKKLPGHRTKMPLAYSSTTESVHEQGHPKDTYSFFICCPTFSWPFWFAAIVWCIQIGLYYLVLADRMVPTAVHQLEATGSSNRNIFNVPGNVPESVRTAQIISIFIAIVLQNDLHVAMERIDEGFLELRGRGQYIKFRWYLSYALRFVQGVLGVCAAFVLIIQESNVFELMLNLTGLVFISELDDIAFQLGLTSYFGHQIHVVTCRIAAAADTGDTRISAAKTESKNTAAMRLSFVDAETIKSYRYTYRKPRKQWKRATVLFILTCLMYGIFATVVWYQNGERYVCSNLYVEFDGTHFPAFKSYTGQYQFVSTSFAASSLSRAPRNVDEISDRGIYISKSTILAGSSFTSTTRTPSSSSFSKLPPRLVDYDTEDGSVLSEPELRALFRHVNDRWEFAIGIVSCSIDRSLDVCSIDAKSLERLAYSTHRFPKSYDLLDMNPETWDVQNLFGLRKENMLFECIAGDDKRGDYLEDTSEGISLDVLSFDYLLQGLETLDLSNMGFTGSIPIEFGDLTTLTKMDLSNNYITGTIPQIIWSKLTKLQTINFASNLLTGTIPSSLLHPIDTFGYNSRNRSRTIMMPSLEHLYMHDNQLNGTIPGPFLAQMTQLVTLDVGKNQIDGSLPSELSLLTNLQKLYLKDNQINGTISREFRYLSSLLELDLNHNSLTGSLDEILVGDIDEPALSNLQRWGLQENRLTGSIPTTIGRLTALELISWSNNQFASSIPSEIGHLTSLNYLYLANNRITGPIPSEIGLLSNLHSVLIQNNQLTRSIPSELGMLSSLARLSLANNSFTGSSAIPSEMGMLSNLQVLLINGNNSTMTIPTEVNALCSRENTLWCFF